MASSHTRAFEFDHSINLEQVLEKNGLEFLDIPGDNRVVVIAWSSVLMVRAVPTVEDATRCDIEVVAGPDNKELTEEVAADLFDRVEQVLENQ